MSRSLNNVSVDTTGLAIQGDGGSKVISVWGADFGGGSVALEISPDGGTTWNIMIYKGSPAVFTNNVDLFLVKFPQSYLIRATLSGSTGASGVNADITQ